MLNPYFFPHWSDWRAWLRCAYNLGVGLWYGFLSAALIVALICFLSSGCTQTKSAGTGATPVVGEGGSAELQTVEYDGHRFIVLVGGYKGCVIHHPGCPCLRKE